MKEWEEEFDKACLCPNEISLSAITQVKDFIRIVISHTRKSTLQEIKEHLIYVFEELEPNADRNRILEYIKKL